MAAGAGYLFGAISTTVVVLISLYLLRRLRAIIVPRLRTNYGIMNLTFDGPGGNISEVNDLLDRHEIIVRSLDAELEDEKSHYSIRMRIPPSRNAQEVLEEITALPGVKRVGITGLRDVE